MTKKKGVFLIYVLFTAVLISVFLLTAVKDMHDSYFLTKRFSGDNKAYWASIAGIEYCEYKIKTDVSWPFLQTNEETSNDKFGSFQVELKKYGNDGYSVHGLSEKENEEFYIYFSNKNSNKIADEAKKLEGSDSEISIVHESFPDDSYCSYNSMTQSKTLTFDNSKNQEEGCEDYASLTLVVSKNNHKAKVTFPGIYIVSDGRSGSYKSVIEKMFILDNNNTSPAGIYAGGNININLLGNNSTFKISQTSNLKPEIYCKKNITIDKSGVSSTDNEDYTIPMSARTKGTIYFGANSEFTLIDDIKNTNNFSTTGQSGEYVNFKKQFGINLDTYTESKDRLFPKLSWDTVESSVTNNVNFQSIPGGSYVAIYEDLTSIAGKVGEDVGKRYPASYKGGYVLVRLNNSYLKPDGSFDDQKFKNDLDKARQLQKDANSKIFDNNNVDVTDYDENGNPIGSHKEITAKGRALQQIKASDRGVIIEFLRKRYGLPETNYSDDYEGCEKYIIASQKPEIDGIAGDAKGVFSINTLKIDNVTEIDSTTDKTPIITLNKSAKTDNFSLFTLTREKNGDYTLDKTKSTDLIFGEKNYGISERNLFKTRYSNNETSSEENEDDKGSLIPVSNPITLYTTGDSIINGKLSGTGQILSNGYTYFKAGTQLNLDSNIDDTDNKLTSKIAVYSKNNIQMGVPEGKENSNILREQIKKVLKEISKEDKDYYSYQNIASKALYDLRINTNEIMKDDVSYGVNQDLLPNAPANPNSHNPSSSSTNQTISLSTYMQKYYGFSYREKEDYINNIVMNNVYVNKHGRYKLVGEDDIAIFDYQAPSGFSGLIYTCGDFKTNAINSNLTINGIIVAYGGDPGASGDKGKPGKSNSGNIKIDGCKNFTLTYNSTDLDNIRRLCYEGYPINLTCVYYNRL